ncbi:hypothetical protein BC343_14870 [Mucilaginibacter pedocola]|uniref:Uncharacterized protein n=1 Tax=Mucilaginibacter pedocola TaxID=1792845 RepID=A0A1S9P8U6_9SPHI|nr:hypothetical protein BC343_14870 [Mucilaginibacter pedocola]
MVSGNDEGTWNAMAGYRRLTENGNDDLRAVWVQGLLHPTEKVISSSTEGSWTPFPGYKLIDDNSLAVTWDTEGRGYNDLHIFSSSSPDDYIAYPGYEFVDDGNNLQTQWKMGLQNYLHPEQVSGVNEGEWLTDPNYTPPDNRASGFWQSFFSLVGAAVNNKIEEKVGENPLSGAVDDGLKRSFFNGVGKMITNDNDDPYNGVKPSKKHINW